MAKRDKVLGEIQKAPARKPPTEGRWLSPFDEMDRLFEDFFGRSLGRPLGWGRPALAELETLGPRSPRVDVLDHESEVVIRAELPGVDKKDVDISINDNSVSIQAHSERESTESEANYFRREIGQASYSRTIALPAYVDVDKGEAKFEGGVLELTLPKLEQSKRRRIEVK